MHPNSLANLRAPWQPGQSGNQGGSSKKKPLQELIDEELHALVLKIARESGIDPADVPLEENRRLVVRTLLTAAVKDRDWRALKEVLDRLFGAVRQEVHVDGAVQFEPLRLVGVDPQAMLDGIQPRDVEAEAPADPA